MTNALVTLRNQGLERDEETRSPAVSKSSKFARWFLEEGKPIKMDLVQSLEFVFLLM